MISAFSEVSATYPWFFATVAFVFGACIGSFLNVVIYRLPAGQSIVRPGSHCRCGAPIGWRDNLPILSWFILRGRARCCGQPYSFRYPFVELLTALLFLACWLLFPAGKAMCAMAFLGASVAATFIDLDHMIIPDAFTLGLGAVGITLSVLVPSLHGFHGDLYVIDSLRGGIASLQGLLIGSGVVLWIALVAEVLLKKEAMGFGDVKFAGAIGAFCGWQGAVFALFGGALVGTIWLVLALTWQKLAGRPAPVAPASTTADGAPAPLGLGVHVPFGPMLAIAAGLYLLLLQPWVDAWFGQVAELL